MTGMVDYNQSIGRRCMKRFIPLAEKIGEDDDVDVTVVLMHSVSYLDHAAVIARKNEDPEMLMQIFKQSLKASDRLTSIAFHLGNDEEGNYGKPIDNTEGFGFQLAPQERECELEEDD